QASEETKVGAADRIDGANTGCVAEDRLKDEAQGEALLGDPFVLGGSQSGGEVVGAKLQEVGDEEEAARAGRGQPAGEESSDVMLDVMAGDDTGARLAGAVKDFDRLLGKEPSRECRRWHPFFLARP